MVAVFQTRWAVTGAVVHERATRFWGQLYLVNYALGIVAGILLELQFGLHFPGLLDVAGEVFGAPLAVETMVAFFLESTLLGLWVFGWHQLNRWVHTVVFWLVVLTGYASAFAVMVANGFLRHPVGYELVDGVAHITDTAALVLNPAAVLSLGHVVGACLLAGAFVVIGVSAWHLRRETGHDELFQRSLRTGVVVGARRCPARRRVRVLAVLATSRTATSTQSPVVGVALGFMILGGFALFLGAVPMLALMVRGALFRLPPGSGDAVYGFLTRGPARAVRARDPRLAGARDRPPAVGRRRRAADLRRHLRAQRRRPCWSRSTRARRAHRDARGRRLGRARAARPPRPGARTLGAPRRAPARPTSSSTFAEASR